MKLLKKDKKLCFVLNIGPHYRLPIFKAIDERFSCSFYFGSHMKQQIKTFDYKILEGYVATLKNYFWGNFYWQSKSLRIIFKKYDMYFFVGEPYCLSSWVLLVLCRLLGKQTVAWTHGWYGREGFVKRLIKRIYYSLYTKLMVYNEYSIKLMEQVGFSTDKMFCIANSLDTDKDMKIRSELKPSNIYREHFKNDCPTIIYCGRIQKWKRLDLIIHSIAQFKNEGKTVNVVFLGKDIENVALDKLAESLGVSNQVWMYGPCYDEQVIGEMFYNADVCLSPGNVGLTAIHALSFGCPVITHDDFKYQNPEFEAIVPGVTGDFFKKDDMADMKAKIELWINKDEEARNNTRINAFKEIERKWNIHYQLGIIEKIVNRD